MIIVEFHVLDGVVLHIAESLGLFKIQFSSGIHLDRINVNMTVIMVLGDKTEN